MIYPQHDEVSQDYPEKRAYSSCSLPTEINKKQNQRIGDPLGPSEQGYKLADFISVARVRPRTSKGITDLLLPQTSVG